MIRKLVRQMLTAQIFSALTVSLCLLIDNIMIGRYLGVQALAAYSVANPILLALGALGSMLSSGIQVVGSRSLARGDKADTDAGYSSAIMLTVCISGLFMLAVFLFRSPLATALGAGNAGGICTGWQVNPWPVSSSARRRRWVRWCWCHSCRWRGRAPC